MEGASREEQAAERVGAGQVVREEGVAGPSRLLIGREEPLLRRAEGQNV